METRATPSPGAGEVVLKVLAAGICGTDRRTFREGHPRVVLPRVLGHEVCGVVELAGRGVAGVRPGDRVALQPAIPDGRCGRCLEGLPELCESPSLVGYGFDGAFAEKLLVPAEAIARGCVVPVPREVTDAEAAIAEPLACALHGLSFLRSPKPGGRFGPRFEGLSPGAVVAVLGGGPMGCLLVLGLKWMGARPFLFESDPARLPSAFRACGPDGVVAVPGGEGEAAIETARAYLKSAAGAEAADAAVVACSDPGAQRIACELVKRGGSVSLFGGLSRGAAERLPANRIHYRSLTVSGASGCSAAHLGEALALIAEGAIDPEPVITRRSPLSRIAACLEAEAPDGLKTVILPGPR